MKRSVTLVGFLIVVISSTLCAEIRTLTADFVDTAPVIDGVVSADEWGNSDGDWTILKSGAIDDSRNRFAAYWDLNGIYFLHQVDYQGWSSNGIGQIDFGYEHLQLYFDPNTDNETNEQTDANDTGVDGYMIAVNQPLGASGIGSGLSADFQRAGSYSEAHVNSLTGDQGQPWSGFRGVQIRQQTSVDDAFGVSEIFIPWSDFDATNPDFGFDPDFGDDIGLYHAHSPAPGTEWYFDIGRIQSDGTTVAWSTEGDGITSLAQRPHGILRFVEEPSIVDVSCDIDRDGDCDAIDIDVLSEQVQAGSLDPIYDLDRNEKVDSGDRRVWVTDRDFKNTWFGDANLDGEFGSADLVVVFQAGQYEDEIEANSGWASGDWNGDKEFTTTDLVVAFQDGGYELGPRQAVQSVPEPTQNGCLFLMILVAVRCKLRIRTRSEI